MPEVAEKAPSEIIKAAALIIEGGAGLLLDDPWWEEGEMPFTKDQVIEAKDLLLGFLRLAD